MTHPYHELIDQEAARAEDDLEAFRTRALTVVTTSSGIVTLLIGIVAFAAGDGADQAIPDAAMIVVALALGLFIGAAAVALWSNKAAGTRRPSGEDLARITTPEGWTEFDAGEQEREIAEVLVPYILSVRAIGDTAASRLNAAIALQVAGLSAAAAAALLTMFG